MAELKSKQDEKIWKTFIRNHRGMLAVFITTAIVAVFGAVFVFLWFVDNAQATSLIPRTLNLWTMGYLVTFILFALFWEILFIGIPVIIFVVVIYLFWWKRLPDEERYKYRDRNLHGKKSRSRDWGGAMTFLINIGFIIKVYIDGNWNISFASWSFDYLVYSYLWIIIWFAIIFGIPLAIGGAWWIHREMKKTS